MGHPTLQLLEEVLDEDQAVVNSRGSEPDHHEPLVVPRYVVNANAILHAAGESAEEPRAVSSAR